MNVLHRETLTVDVVTQGGVNEDGVPTSTTVPRTVSGFNVQPVISVAGTEQVDDQLLVTKRWKVSGPVIDGLTSSSRIHWRDRTFQPWGDVEAQHFSVLRHMEFYMVDWEG